MRNDSETPEITEVRYSDTDIAYQIELPISPFGTTDFAAENNSSNSATLLKELTAVWSSLWPEMLELLQDGIKDYDVDTKLGSDEFMGFVARTTPGEFKSDEADIFLRLEFEAPPLWDYFIRNGAIVHSQPVF